MKMSEFLISFWHDLLAGQLTVWQKLTVFGCLLLLSVIVAFLCVAIFRKIAGKYRLFRRMKEEKISGAIKYPLFWCFLLTGLYFSLKIFAFGPRLSDVIYRVFFAIIVLLLLRVLLNVTDVISDAFRQRARKLKNSYKELLVNLVEPTVKTLIWLVGILFILDNVFHFHIGTLLAGAGIASMAIAFAAQNTIANLFGAISLIIEQPFSVGQTIRVNDKDGVVEAIGLRSVRLLALDGTVLYIPNKTVAESPIVNFSKRPYYKYVFTLNMTYSHSPEKLQKGKELLQEILMRIPLVEQSKRTPCITFENFGPYSLDLQVICWVQTGVFAEFAKTKNELNTEILRVFNENGFDFAFPTQSILVEKIPAKE